MAKNTRTDAHRPSEIIPANYSPRMCYSLATTIDGWPMPAIGMEQVIAMTSAATLAGFEIFGSPGKCGVCGAWFIYGELWQHDPTSALVHMGHDCAEKYEMLMDRSAWELENGRVRAAAATQIARSKNAAQRVKFCEAHEGLADALALGDANGTKGASILHDLAAKLTTYKTLSEKQIAFALKLAGEIRNPAPAKPEELHVPAPVGKGVCFEGEIVSAKLRESQWGTAWKITVKITTDAGSWLAWGTAPSALLDRAVELAEVLGRNVSGPGERIPSRSEEIRTVLVGRRVALKATLEHSTARVNDGGEEIAPAQTHFAFMARPSGTFCDVYGCALPPPPKAPRKPKLCPVCKDGACETKSEQCGK